MKVHAHCPFQPKDRFKVEGGFHCSQCRQVVWDMTQVDQIDPNEWKDEKKCGMFRLDQLEEPTHFSGVRKLYFSFLLLLASLGWNWGPVRAQVTSDSPAAITKTQGKKDPNPQIHEASPERALHWWQFRKKRKKRKYRVIGCPSF